MTPENVIEQWANYFNNGDLEGITSFIIEIVTLLPTFLPNYSNSKEQISGYFSCCDRG